MGDFLEGGPGGGLGHVGHPVGHPSSPIGAGIVMSQFGFAHLKTGHGGGGSSGHIGHPTMHPLSSVGVNAPSHLSITIEQFGGCGHGSGDSSASQGQKQTMSPLAYSVVSQSGFPSKSGKSFIDTLSSAVRSHPSPITGSSGRLFPMKIPAIGLSHPIPSEFLSVTTFTQFLSSVQGCRYSPSAITQSLPEQNST